MDVDDLLRAGSAVEGHRSTAPGLVGEWLEQLEAEEDEPPSTPGRTRQMSESHDEQDEPSPTGTNFSSDSIFDKPHDRDDTFSDTSSTSVGKLGEQVEENIVSPEDALEKNDCTAGLNSYEPPIECNVPRLGELPNSPLPPLDPNQPRLVWITSCLQCTYAGLPCSRTLPTCSRCKRAGRGDLCLLSRRRLLEERTPGDYLNTTPTLLKIKGDDEEVWEKKVALSEELHQIWLEKLDRQNWVLPLIDGSKRGDFRTHGTRYHSSRLHPGEGYGRQAYRELLLA